MTHTTVTEEKSELDYYLDEPMDKSTNFNILDWWKANSANYLVILKMTYDILAIPVFIWSLLIPHLTLKGEYLTSVAVI